MEKIKKLKKIKKEEIENKIKKAALGPWPKEPLKEKTVFELGSFGAFSKKEINENFKVSPPPNHLPNLETWVLDKNWVFKALNILEEKIKTSRSLKLFMENCQRCGLCADKCPFYMGSGDSLNMPIFRADLLRAVWQRNFTLLGKYFPSLSGAEDLNLEMLKKWFKYFFQCSLCRRCAVFCPMGIDTSEFTKVGREILWKLGLAPDWISQAAWNCYETGNHMGLKEKTIFENINFLLEDLNQYTGLNIEPRINKKNADFLFILPSSDTYSEPGIYTFLGSILLFEHLNLNYTLSTFAFEAGNMGSYLADEVSKTLLAKYYEEAKRLNAKWIMGGECGIMAKSMHQQLGTMWEAPSNLQVPYNPVTGTVFTVAKHTKMIHILEFMADCLVHNKLNLNPKQNDYLRLTYHDSCNTARVLGLIEEPRIILKACSNNFYEMPNYCIKEKTLCCGSGGGLNGGEYINTRLMGGYPRAKEIIKLIESKNINAVACNCAIDRNSLSTLMDYWAPNEVEVYGLSELLANALIIKSKKTLNLRGDFKV